MAGTARNRKKTELTADRRMNADRESGTEFELKEAKGTEAGEEERHELHELARRDRSPNHGARSHCFLVIREIRVSPVSQPVS